MTHSPQVALPHFLKAFSLQTKQGRQGTWVRSDRFVPYLLVSLNYQKNTHLLKAFSIQTKQGRQGTWVRSDRFVPYLLVSLNYQKNTHLLKAFSIQTKQGRQGTWVRSDRYVPYMILSLNCQNIHKFSKLSQSKLKKDILERGYALTYSNCNFTEIDITE